MADEQNLSLEIKLEKESYLSHEPIWLDITLKNISCDTISTTRLSPPNQGGVGIELKNSEGILMSYTGPDILLGPRERIVLDSGEEYYDCFDLLELFSTSKPESMSYNFFGSLPVGKYTLRATYGHYYSNEITFKIEKQSGQEEESYQMMVDAFNLWARQDYELTIQKFRNILEEYPKSVYAGKALRQIIGFQMIYNKLAISELQTPQEMLDSFTNSGYSNYCLGLLVWKKTKEEQQDLLQQIIENYPNTRSAKFAEQMLRNLEKETVKSNSKE
ncbi:MAG: hypothetical protein ABIJ12_09350 [bacterium]